jgi:hypothetical protein
MLDTLPFTVVRARELGVGAKRLRQPDLQTPTTGARWAANRVLSVRDVARAAALVLPPDVVFSHVTGARLLGLPTPHRWRPEEPLEVTRYTDAPRIERAVCRSHRGLESRGVVEADGLLVVSGWDTWADLSPRLALDDLVAVGDALLAPRGTHRIADADIVVGRRVGGRGVVRLRAAARLLRVGAASPWESKARVAFALANLPEPELNVDLFTDDGIWLGRPDLVWRRRRVLAEFDGDQHRTDRTAWQYERERRARLEDDGWRYVEMTSLSLTSPRHRTALLRRLASLLQ